METYIFILGRSPELAAEELLVVLEPLGHIVEVGREFLVFSGSIDATELLSRLGGTIKIAQSVKTLDHWHDLTEDHALHVLRPELSKDNDRFVFGASAYGIPQDGRKHIHRIGIALKKYLKQGGRKSRFVNNREAVVSSVAVKKSSLLNRELIIASGKRCYVGLTRAVQDFESYSLRDYGRPSRNMERGMLPPKVAQIMLNLARVRKQDRVLDPFCGGGTVLQEALLMGLSSVYGSDKDELAILEAEKNFAWLEDRYNVPRPTLAVQNIGSLQRTYEENFFDVVVTEPYLGPSRKLAKRGLTRPELEKIVSEGATLYKTFFSALREVTKPHARLVTIFPIYRLFGGVWHLPPLETFEPIGWRLQNPRVEAYLDDAQFSQRGQLLYTRDDQVVAREITVWERA